ncbi:MAG: 50S ribosomal protein L1 [Chlamydiales bacterium]|jgi:large subunit ribosomal protein L1|nr:50S ribosomal protein L1 [Chlamydiales bacterium]NCF71324.1 50S ribosomal protein L1 [Chlamydiales bacterium]
MTKQSKRFREIAKLVDSNESYSVEEAVEILKKCPAVKFDQTVDISLTLGVDPRKSDQQVRGTVSLPNGTGKSSVVVVLAKSEKATEAKDAGADFVGDNDIIEKIKGGWTSFDALIATPDMMREVGKLGKILGPRGLMPTPKAGTVTKDIASTVKEIKAGRIEFKVDKHGVINSLVGKLSFSSDQLLQNIKSLISAISKQKPATAKGEYMKNLSLSSTMGPGVKVKLSTATN